MSVATTAMTMDDQRPNVVMNTYDKLSSKPYEQSLSAVGGSGGAPASGPASPTPSGSEEPHAYQHHNAHHHHHSSHHQHQYHQQQQLMPPTALSATQQLQQQQELKQPSNASAAEAVAAAEHRQRLLEEEVDSLKLEQTRLAQQCVDAQRREKILMRRLANKEQEFQDYVSQIAEYKAAQAPSALALRSALLDPAVNLLFEKLKKELKATKAKLEETQNELSAWKFTPDSNTGKRLMAKCRLLYQENEELGKMTSNGRLAKLETELAMQKSFSEEVKKSQSELDDFLQELDEDVEGMQSTILFLQQELKTTRDRIQLLEKENYQLRSGGSDDIVVKDDVAPLPLGLGGAELNGDSGSGSGNNSHKCLNENEGVYNVGNTIDKHDSNDNVNDNDTSNLAHQQQTPAYNNNNSNNNNVIINAPTVLVSTSSSYAANTSDMRYQPSTPLETIDENVCLRMAPAPVERFNGEEQVVAVGVNVVDDGGVCMTNTNSISLAPVGGCVGVLRTAASRKRPYDAGLEVASISDQYVDLGPAPTPEPVLMTPTPLVTVGTHVTAPRTLPPKKSKLRVMPIQRLCALANDPNEAESYTTNMGVGVGVLGMGVGVGAGVGVGVVGGGVVVENVHFFDNAAAAANITNEETIITSSGVGVVSTTTVASMSMGEEVMVIDGTAGNGNGNGSAGMAQRIMTRRRSLRTQQNGGDSSH